MLKTIWKGRLENIGERSGDLEQRVHAIKLIFDNGVIEDVKEGIVITKEADNMSFTAVNVEPLDQMILTAITFHSLFSEYLQSEEEEFTSAEAIDSVLVDFIKVLLQLKYKNENKTKGDVLQ